ncbi:MAG TPA: cytochrome P450 [Burkholderiaceae bacterium]|nr:cytochrome P450 [Burkholderiaceae bacterium]
MTPEPTLRTPSSPHPRRIDDLPGPRGWPLVGNLFQVNRASIHRSVERWCREFGAAFTFRIGRRRIVVVADHEQIAAVLRDRPDGWRRSQQLQAVGREMGLTPGLFGSEGDAWRRQRRRSRGASTTCPARADGPWWATCSRSIAPRFTKASNAGAASSGPRSPFASAGGASS